MMFPSKSFRPCHQTPSLPGTRADSRPPLIHTAAALTAAMLLLAASATSAQAQSLPSYVFGGGNSVTIMLPASVYPPVTDVPFTAEEVKTDGAEPNASVSTLKLYRDTEGRTRVERSLGARADGPMLAEIVDPIEGVYWALDSKSKTAHRVRILKGFARQTPTEATVPPKPRDLMPLGEALGDRNVSGRLITPGGTNTPSDEPAGPTSESLGVRQVAGVEAHGQLVTLTMPAPAGGAAVTQTTETWISPQLQLTLIETIRGASETKRELRNLVQEEPDAALFTAPDGYTVVDEPNMFMLRLAE